eukprot:612229-Karenia_brevis.AAC.1
MERRGVSDAHASFLMHDDIAKVALHLHVHGLSHDGLYALLSCLRSFPDKASSADPQLVSPLGWCRGPFLRNLFRGGIWEVDVAGE